jgi:AcrR family transcriptional regulator
LRAVTGEDAAAAGPLQAAVGLARIMAEADLTVGTFYTHFKSKEALLRSLRDRLARPPNE